MDDLDDDAKGRPYMIVKENLEVVRPVGAERIGIPFLSSYLKSIGSDYTHGANFATLASTVRLPQTSLFVSGLSPFALPIQVDQLKHFKAQVDSLYSQGPTNLPPPDVLGKSLYTFYIGQNDFTSDLAKIGITGVKERLPEIISGIVNSIKDLYALGGRAFFVLNLAPIGCYPSFLVQLPHGDDDIDEFGCLISYNNVVFDYNNMLRDVLNQTRQELFDAQVIYADSHKVLLELFQHPTSHGLKYGPLACCGNGGDPYNFNPQVFCGNTKVIDGQNLTASACEDPENYVSWDGIHATEAANKIVTDAILSGDFTDHLSRSIVHRSILVNLLGK
ncbi:GDSL esterase/lipase At4g01130-like [Bidens hawaiensis]|uniref:GDSL esterase/lipase At4g01130-like n=1 Tax=Bidens hawaiensis TaxID=980011 RepID=UPI00404B5B53